MLEQYGCGLSAGRHGARMGCARAGVQARAVAASPSKSLSCASTRAAAAFLSSILATSALISAALSFFRFGDFSVFCVGDSPVAENGTTSSPRSFASVVKSSARRRSSASTLASSCALASRSVSSRCSSAVLSSRRRFTLRRAMLPRALAWIRMDALHAFLNWCLPLNPRNTACGSARGGVVGRSVVKCVGAQGHSSPVSSGRPRAAQPLCRPFVATVEYQNGVLIK